MTKESEVVAAGPSSGKRVAAYLLTLPLMLIVWFSLLPVISNTAIYLGVAFADAKMDPSMHFMFVGYLLAGAISIFISLWSLRLAGRGAVAAAPLVQILAYAVLIGLLFGTNALVQVGA